MSTKGIDQKDGARSTRSGDRAKDPRLLGRKSVLLGMLTSGFVMANASQTSAVAGTLKPSPIAATQPAYVTKWTPGTAYALGTQVISPCNDVVSAKVAHTSSAAYTSDTAKWTVCAAFANKATETTVDSGRLSSASLDAWLYTTLRNLDAFTPASLSGLAAWYDASQITGTTDGAALSQWNDLSGNARHLRQATGASQPIYKTAIQNGKGVVRFDGTNDVMSVVAAIPKPFTVFLVGRATQGTIANETFFGGGNSVSCQADTSGHYRISGGPPTWASAAGGTKVNSFVVLCGVFDDATSLIRVNGVETVDTLATGSAISAIHAGASNGSADFLKGDIAELIVYSRHLSATEILQVEGYLS